MEWNEQVERRRKLIARITRAWTTAADQGENPLTTEQLAAEAVRAVLDPETCADQECADGSCEGCQQASSPAPDWPTVGEPCPKCRELPTAEDTRLIAVAGGCVRCPRCRGIFMDRNLTSRGVRLPAEVVDATIYCGEEHPDTGWVCDKPADHETGGEVGDQWHHWSNVGKTWMVIPESRVTIPTAGEETLTEQLARALEFLNYIITQGSAPGTATITKKIVNRAQGRARDLERALMWAADREAL